jgi:hypothetical protein
MIITLFIMGMIFAFIATMAIGCALIRNEP